MSSIVAETAPPDQSDSSLRLYLSPAEFIDSDHPGVRAKAAADGRIGDRSGRTGAAALSRAVRDGIRYDPYIDYTDPETYRASSVLAKGHGYCVGKASLYVALCRAIGIPARLGLADVKNHLATPRLLETGRHRRVRLSRLCRGHAGARMGEGDADVQRQPLPEARRAAAGVLRRERRAAAAVRRRRPRVHVLHRPARHVLRRAGEVPDRRR